MTSFIQAQEIDKTEQKSREKANELFQKGNYIEAMPEYSHLLSLHKKDPLLNYRFGVCYLFADRRDTDAPINYIKKADGHDLSGNDKYLFYYYLGMAYHLNYKFIEAIDYYKRFQQITPEKEIAKFDLELSVGRLIEMAENGLELLGEIKDLYVFNKIDVNKQNFYRSYKFDDFGGKLLYKPSIFKTKTDKKKSDNSIVFFSDNNKMVFYSSYGDSKNNSRDIYYSEKNKNNEWSEAKKLSDKINTPYDEDYPYLLSDGKTLYFSSKGHNSMGGYDIFKSVFDSVSGEWSEPKNIEFAINTPFDDILFVTDRYEQFAYFSSDRTSVNNTLTVYKVRIDRRPKEILDVDFAIHSVNVNALSVDSNYINTIAMIKEKSKLDVNANEEDFEQQIYVDEYKLQKFNLSRNATGEEVGDRTFAEIDTAKQSLNYVKAKRDAIYNLLSSKQVKLEENPQNTKLQNEIDLLELMEKDLLETITEREDELDGLLNKAGYIQQMTAASQRIDSSLVLLIDLLENLNEYEEKNYTVMDEMTAQYIAAEDGYEVPSEQFLADYMMEEVDQLRDKAQTLRKDAAKLNEGDEQIETILNEAFSLENQADDKEKQADDLYEQAQAIKVYSASGDLADISVLLNEIDGEYDAGNYLLAYNDTSSNTQNNNQNTTNNNQNNNTVNIPDIWPDSLDYQDYTNVEQDIIINTVQNINEITELNKQNQDKIAALLLTSNHYIEKAEMIENEMRSIKDKIENTENVEDKMIFVNEYNQLNDAYQEAVLNAQTSFKLYDVVSENNVAGPDQMVLDDIYQDILTKVEAHLYDEAQEKTNSFNTIKEDLTTVEELLLDYNEAKENEYNIAVDKQEKLIKNLENEQENLIQINNDIANINKQIADETNETKIHKLENKIEKLTEKQLDKEMLINDIENDLVDMSMITTAYTYETSFINELDNNIIQIDENAIDKIDNDFVNNISTLVANYEEENVISDTYDYYPDLKEITYTQIEIVENTDTTLYNTEIETWIENNNNHLQDLNNYIANNSTTTNNNTDLKINKETVNNAKIIVVESTIASVKIQISQIEEQIQQSTNEEEKAVLEQKRIENNIQLENLISQKEKYPQNQDANSVSSNEENVQEVIYALYHQIKQANNSIDSLYDSYKQTTDVNEKQFIQEQIENLQNIILTNQNNANELIVMTSQREYYEKMQEINSLLIVNNIFTNGDAEIDNRMSVIIDNLHEGDKFNILLNQTEDSNEKAEIYTQKIESLHHAIELQGVLLEDLANYVPENRIDTSFIANVNTNLIANNNNQDNNNTNNHADVNNNNNADNNNQNNNNNNDNQSNVLDSNAVTHENNTINFYNPDEQTPSDKMIPVDVELPSGLIFKVQFAALKRELPFTSFEGIEPIVGESSTNGFIRYMAGSFTDINLAYDSRNTIRTMGYQDAFVVAYMNGERITVGEARTIMNIPDAVATNNNIITEETQVVKTEETSNLFYTVQIGVYGTQRTSARLFGITPLIEDEMENGYYRYYSGFYKNKEEAILWRNEVRAKGVPDAFVVAINNGNKVSIGEADNLVEQGANIYNPIQNTNDIDTVVVVEPIEEVFDPELIAYKLQLKNYTIDISLEQYYKIYYMKQTRKIQNHYIFAKNIFRVYLPSLAEENDYDRALKIFSPDDINLSVFYGTKKISIKKAINILNSSFN